MQEFWSGLLYPPQGIFPTQGSNLGSLHWEHGILAMDHQGSPLGSSLDSSICDFLPAIFSHFFFVTPIIQMEKEMATHSNVLAWEIPRTEEPSGLQPIESQRAGCD